jgi:hypothetical protein
MMVADKTTRMSKTLFNRFKPFTAAHSEWVLPKRESARLHPKSVTFILMQSGISAKKKLRAVAA